MGQNGRAQRQSAGVAMAGGENDWKNKGPARVRTEGGAGGCEIIELSEADERA